MKHFRGRRFVAVGAAVLALALVAAACGDDSDDSSSETDTTDAPAEGDEPGAFAAENYTTDLSADCPEEIIIQKDWLAEAEHAALYQLIGGAGESSQYIYEGPLGSTGVNLKIIDGGPGLGDGVTQPTSLYAGNLVTGDTPDLAYVGTDDAILYSAEFPTTAVVTPLEFGPTVLWYDPEAYPDGITSLDDVVTQAEDGAEIYVTTKQFAYVQYLIGEGVPESAFIEGYAGDKERFVSSGGEVINQGYASNEIYTMEVETPEWNKPIDYFYLKDAGFEPYPSALAVRTDRLEELSPCLEGLVPLLQQAQIDYLADPTEVNDILTAYNEEGLGAPFWLTSEGLNAAAVEVMEADGLVSNGDDETLGNFDEARVQELIDILLPIFEAQNAETLDPAVTPADVFTNEYIDDSIGL